MAITIEGFTVVVKYERIRPLLEIGLVNIPNSTSLTDDHLWKCGFMAESDARKFMSSLQEHALNTTDGPDPDCVLVCERDRSVEPYCEWLRTGEWEKAVIAWREGTRPESIIAPDGWDPKVGSGLEFHERQFFKFLRLEGNVEVHVDTRTGKEFYLGRTSVPVEALFASASEIVGKYLVTAGQPALVGEAAKEVADAAGMLEKVIADSPDWWQAQWMYGKSQLALGNHEAAYQAFQQAYRVEKNTEVVLRELAGVCLELKKFDEAVSVGEAALALDSDNAELLGNLALAYLLAGRTAHGRKAIDAANKLDPNDRINQSISRIIAEIEEGRREQPESLRDLSKPAKPVKKSFFKLPWK